MSARIAEVSVGCKPLGEYECVRFFVRDQVEQVIDVPTSESDTDATVPYDPAEWPTVAPETSNATPGWELHRDAAPDRRDVSEDDVSILSMDSGEPSSPAETVDWSGHSEFRRYWMSLDAKRRRLEYDRITGSLSLGGRPALMREDSSDA